MVRRMAQARIGCVYLTMLCCSILAHLCNVVSQLTCTAHLPLYWYLVDAKIAYLYFGRLARS